MFRCSSWNLRLIIRNCIFLLYSFVRSVVIHRGCFCISILRLQVVEVSIVSPFIPLLLVVRSVHIHLNLILAVRCSVFYFCVRVLLHQSIVVAVEPVLIPNLVIAGTWRTDTIELFIFCHISVIKQILYLVHPQRMYLFY